MKNIIRRVKEFGRIAGQEVLDLTSTVLERDPAATNALEVMLTSQSVHALLLHRVASALYHSGHRTSAALVSRYARIKTGIEIHPRAKIGHGVLIDHGAGVVIGETAEIGDGCTIYQGVTLGARGGEHGRKRHPTLGRGVLVGAGAVVLGNIRIGNGARIGAGAVVLTPVADNCTAVGIPARIVKNQE